MYDIGNVSRVRQDQSTFQRLSHYPPQEYSMLNNNLFISNYWSNYTGYDLDKNGVGDVPHYPVKLFSYILNEAPEAIVLMRSLFVDIINFSEKVSPVFTPKEVMDEMPSMTAFASGF